MSTLGALIFFPAIWLCVTTLMQGHFHQQRMLLWAPNHRLDEALRQLRAAQANDFSGENME